MIKQELVKSAFNLIIRLVFIVYNISNIILNIELKCKIARIISEGNSLMEMHICALNYCDNILDKGGESNDRNAKIICI